MRFVSLQGGQNFRDLGGYQASDGRCVRWRVLFRSGSMSGLTSGDLEMLQEFGIRTVIDLRSTNERKREPLNQAGGFAPAVFADDYLFEASELGKTLPSPTMEAEQARVAFERSYAAIPFQFAKQYRTMFAHLLDSKVPLIVNCSGGKDRTGVAAALLLTALGVPREAVVEDYLLSRQGFRLMRVDATVSGDPRWRSFPPEVMEILRGVETRYLESAFRAIDSRPDGLDGYFRDELGMKPADLDRLKSFYLE